MPTAYLVYEDKRIPVASLIHHPKKEGREQFVGAFSISFLPRALVNFFKRNRKDNVAAKIFANQDDALTYAISQANITENNTIHTVSMSPIYKVQVQQLEVKDTDIHPPIKTIQDTNALKHIFSEDVVNNANKSPSSLRCLSTNDTKNVIVKGVFCGYLNDSGKPKSLYQNLRKIPARYNQLLHPNRDEPATLDSIIALLEDYYSPKRGFFKNKAHEISTMRLFDHFKQGANRALTGHWKRHHLDQMRTIVGSLNTFKKRHGSNYQIAYDYLARERYHFINLCDNNSVQMKPDNKEEGSFFRRLEAATVALGDAMEKQAPQQVNSASNSHTQSGPPFRNT